MIRVCFPSSVPSYVWLLLFAMSHASTFGCTRRAIIIIAEAVVTVVIIRLCARLFQCEILARPNSNDKNKIGVLLKLNAKAAMNRIIQNVEAQG